MTDDLCSLIAHQANIKRCQVFEMQTSMIFTETQASGGCSMRIQTLRCTAHPETSTSRKSIGTAVMDRWEEGGGGEGGGSDLEKLIVTSNPVLKGLHLASLVLQHRGQALGPDIGSIQVLPCAGEVCLQEAHL